MLEQEMKNTVGLDSMYYDEAGVLRSGARSRDRDHEFRSVLIADNPENDALVTWCVVESNWINAWLAFVHFNQFSPAPGKIHNSNLITIEYDENNHQVRIPKSGLEIASTSKAGHFRVVRESVWKLYCELYPGSGPKITVTGETPEDTSTWNIDLDFYNQQEAAVDDANTTSNIMQQQGVTREDLHLDVSGEEDHLFFSDTPSDKKQKEKTDPSVNFLFGDAS